MIPTRTIIVAADPAFHRTAIPTGSVRDAAGRPLHNARIEFVLAPAAE